MQKMCYQLQHIPLGNVGRNDANVHSNCFVFAIMCCRLFPKVHYPSQCKYLPAVPAAQCPAIVPKILGSRARVPHIEAITRNFRGICPALRNNIRQKLLQAGFVAFMNHMNGSICALVRGSLGIALHAIRPRDTIPYYTITLALGTAATSSGLIDILRHLEPGLSSEAYLRQFHAL